MEENTKIIQSERNRFRSSFVATILFSGVQIYQILIRVVKSKFIALYIGPAGMGVQSLLQSTTDTISAATNLGINTSSVKTIAAAYRDGKSELIAKNVTVQRRLIWITGLVGLFICAVLAPMWSRVSFGTSEYVWPFVMVSMIVLFDQLNKGELALMQGMLRKKDLAKANVIGQSFNAVITIPLYYFLGIKAIVAALVLGSLISLIISFTFSRKIEVAKVSISWRETISIGREMINLGFFLSLQYVLQTLVMLVVRNYVSNVGGVEEVGLFSAGTAIVTTYIGLIFTAIATDYYPRLAGIQSKDEMQSAVNVQAELTILLLAPLVVAFIVFSKPAIILLYSSKFLPIEDMMYWSIGAVLLQALGWAVSYVILAKAKPLYFFLNELFYNIWGLPIKILCYKYWGLTGLGMATMFTYALYLVQVLVVAKKIFDISYRIEMWRRLIVLYIPVVAVVLFKYFFPKTSGYIAGSFVLVLLALLVLLRLNRIMDFKSYLKERKQVRGC